MKASSLDAAKAISLATGSKLFGATSRGVSSEFKSIFSTWRFDKNSNVAWESVNVVFAVRNSTAFVGYLVVKENPNLTTVLNVTMQEGERYHTVTQISDNWSGYEFFTMFTVPTAVSKVQAGWKVPAVSEPWSYACFFHHCDLSVWPGLASSGGGVGGIVQAGTDSGVYCTAGCSYYYEAWYEFYPEPSVSCFSVGPGDSIRTKILERTKRVGGITHQRYDVYVTDLSKGSVCSVNGRDFSQMGTPYSAEFMLERPSYGTTLASLPKFSSVKITGKLYYVGAWHSIFSVNWYDQYEMNNGVRNISVAQVKTGVFTETWLSSSGT